MEENQPLLILTGPTAVGKTALSIRLAKAVDGEIVSADSMQVYRGMDIGSAKIRPEETEGIPHHLIDVLDPEEEFHVVRFQQMAEEAIQEIHAKGKIPILTGGTGFYIQSVLYGIDFTEQEEDPEFRKRMEKFAEEKGAEALHEKLRDVDPASAEKIHPNNIRRTIRALEFYEKTGVPISEHNRKEAQKESPYSFCYFVLTDDRQKIYGQIERRVDRMIEDGLIDEVKRLREQGCTKEMVSMQGLGYRQILSWLDGEISYEEAVRLIKRDTRRFAKRQLTWFRRERDVIWVDRRDFEYDDEQMIRFMLEKFAERTGLRFQPGSRAGSGKSGNTETQDKGDRNTHE